MLLCTRLLFVIVQTCDLYDFYDPCDLYDLYDPYDLYDLHDLRLSHRNNALLFYLPPALEKIIVAQYGHTCQERDQRKMFTGICTE